MSASSLALEFIALTDQQDWPAREALVTDDATFTTPRVALVGPAAMTEFSRGLLSAFPGAAHVVDTVIEGDGRAAVDGTWVAMGGALRVPFTMSVSVSGSGDEARLASVRALFDEVAMQAARPDDGATVRRIFEQGINGHDLAVLRELVDAAYVNHDLPAPAPGPDGIAQVVDSFYAAFPDFHVTVDDVIADGGGRVSTRGRFVGTHDGPFNGIPATGKTVEVKYIDMWRLEDGKAVENWVQLDLLGLLQQVGAVPAPS